MKFRPPGGAGDVRVIVPVAIPVGPPTTEPGTMESPKETPSTVRTCWIETAPREAVIVAVCVEPVTEVEIVNVALVAPDGIRTKDGTVATDVLLLARFTTTPPSGAALLITTVPCDVPPPGTSVGTIWNCVKF